MDGLKSFLFCAVLAALIWIVPIEGQVSVFGQETALPATDATETVTMDPGQSEYYSGTDACCESTCGDCLSYSCCAQPRLYGYIEAVFLDYDNRHPDRVIAVDTAMYDNGNGDGDYVLMTTGNTNLDVEPGFRFLVGYALNQCWAIEFGYLGIYDWEGSATITGEDNLAIPGDLGLASNDFFNGDVFRVHRSSELHSFELMPVRSFCCCCPSASCCEDSCGCESSCGCGPSCGGGGSDCCGTTYDTRCFSLLAGFRYLRLNENFNLNGTDFDEGTSDYHIRTKNDLYGFQLGARWRRGYGCWGWEVTGKAGIYGNDCEQQQYVTDFPPPFMLREPRHHRDGKVAFVGELNLNLTYQLTQCWGIRGGYNFMWLNGVALAPDQLDFTHTAYSGTGLRNSGAAFLHGASIGVEACW